MGERRDERESVEYIDCEVPHDMTLRQWRCAEQPVPRVRRLRAALGRAARRRRRSA